MFCKHNIVCSMIKSQLDIAKLVPASAAYNPLLTDSLQVTTKFSSLPVIKGSSTDWLNCYTELNIVLNINIISTPLEKTIASLDVQLCAKCIQKQSKKEISNNFSFPLLNSFCATGLFLYSLKTSEN